MILYISQQEWRQVEEYCAQNAYRGWDLEKTIIAAALYRFLGSDVIVRLAEDPGLKVCVVGIMPKDRWEQESPNYLTHMDLLQGLNNMDLLTIPEQLRLAAIAWERLDESGIRIVRSKLARVLLNDYLAKYRGLYREVVGTDLQTVVRKVDLN